MQETTRGQAPGHEGISQDAAEGEAGKGKAEGFNPSKIGAEICGRLGLDPKTTSEIRIRLSHGIAEVVVTGFLTETDGKLIGETFGHYRLVEIDGREV